jgi:hypothetical protein
MPNYALLALESALSVFGMRSIYEQPTYEYRLSHVACHAPSHDLRHERAPPRTLYQIP